MKIDLELGCCVRDATEDGCSEVQGWVGGYLSPPAQGQKG